MQRSHNLPYSYDSGASQKTSQKVSRARVSHEPPINNKEKNKNNINNKREYPPLPPFSEKPSFDNWVKSPKKEPEGLEAKKKEKEKSCAEKEKEILYPFAGEKFKQAWALWKRYRQELDGFKYKCCISEQTALNQLKRKALGNQDVALAIMEQSIARGWQGFFDLKDPQEQNRRTTPRATL